MITDKSLRLLHLLLLLPPKHRDHMMEHTEPQITVMHSSYLIMTSHKLAKICQHLQASAVLWAKVKNHVWQCCGKYNWFHSDCVSSKHRQYWWCCTVILLDLGPTEHWSLSTHYSSIRGISLDWSCQKLLMCLTNHCSAVGRQIRVLHSNCWIFFLSPEGSDYILQVIVIWENITVLTR